MPAFATCASRREGTTTQHCSVAVVRAPEDGIAEIGKVAWDSAEPLSIRSQTNGASADRCSYGLSRCSGGVLADQ